MRLLRSPLRGQLSRLGANSPDAEARRRKRLRHRSRRGHGPSKCLTCISEPQQAPCGQLGHARGRSKDFGCKESHLYASRCYVFVVFTYLPWMALSRVGLGALLTEGFVSLLLRISESSLEHVRCHTSTRTLRRYSFQVVTKVYYSTIIIYI